MALLDVIIDVLKINCSVVQCTGYASDIEALFYVFFFPTVFIILFIWVVTGVITQQIGGKTGGLRILVSVALYAFIVFQGYYNLFVSLSKLWWLLLATLLGLYIFIRRIIHGGGGGGKAGGSPMAGISGGALREGKDMMWRQVTNFWTKKDKDIEEHIEEALDMLERYLKESESENDRVKTAAITNFPAQADTCDQLIKQYQSTAKFAGREDFLGKAKKFEKRYQKLIKDFKPKS